jgi:hypothetical protein
MSGNARGDAGGKEKKHGKQKQLLLEADKKIVHRSSVRWLRSTSLLTNR